MSYLVSIRIWENKKVLMVYHQDFFVFPMLILAKTRHHQDFFVFPWENKKVLVIYHGDFFVFPRNIQDAYNFFYKYPLYCQVININPENASSRKLGNQNWFSNFLEKIQLPPSHIVTHSCHENYPIFSFLPTCLVL